MTCSNQIKVNYADRARVGVILPSGNTVAEPQFYAMMPEGVSMHVTRLRLVGTTEEALLGMTQDIESAAELLSDLNPDLILFHCTAVSTISEELERSIIQRIEGASSCLVTATSQAIVNALKALRAKKIVMLSPYPDSINIKERAFLERAGFEIVGSGSIPCTDVHEMVEVPARRWLSLCLDNQVPEADAYLLSCTAIRTAEIVDELERALGRPVITSNTAALWHCLCTLNISYNVAGFGQIFHI